MSRYEDTYKSLHQRATASNLIDSDIFVSIHANAWTNEKANGFEVYHFPDSSPGNCLAEKTYKSFMNKMEGTINGRGVKAANFYVLRETAMPAILIELAFITNPQEEKLLNSYYFIQSGVNQVSEGIKKYFKG